VQQADTALSTAVMINGMVTRDDGSWRAFLDATGPVVKGVCRRAGLSEDEISDVTQILVERLLADNCKILRELDLDAADSLYRWVKVVVSRIVIDQKRREGVRTGRESKWGEVRWTSSVTKDVTGEIDDRITIETVLSSLDPNDRILLLMDYREMRDAEIAQVLGVSEPAAQQRLRRLRERIRRKFPDLKRGGSE